MARCLVRSLNRMLEIKRSDAERRDRYRRDPVAYLKESRGASLWWRQRQVLRALARPPFRVLAKSGNGTGKCVSFGERLMLADGSVVEAETLIGREFSLVAWSPDGVQSIARAYAEDDGVKPVFRLTTESGRSIVRTGNHPVWRSRVVSRTGKPLIPGEAGWRRIDEIVPGDLVLVPVGISVSQGERRSDDEVKLLGYLLGDGGTTKAVTFTQLEGRPKDEFRAIAERLGCAVVQTTDPNTIAVRGWNKGKKGSNPALELTRSWGIHGKKSSEKSFPDWAWRLPDDQLALMLNRLFACDGWAVFSLSPGSTKNNRGNITIGICLASERMIRDIEFAMVRLGVPGNVRKRSVKYNGGRRECWEWSARDVSSIRRFADVVGIFGKEEAVERLLSVADTKNADKSPKWRSRTAPPGYRWERVKSVDPEGDRRTVAICVPGHETFLSTFVEHNTFLAGAFADWRYEMYDPGIVLVTGPKFDQIKDTTFKEIRRFRRGDPDVYSKNPIVESSFEHWIHGTTASDPTAFQGHHDKAVAIVFEEAVGIYPELWNVVRGIIVGGECAWLSIYNPTDRDCRAFEEESAVDADGNPQWTVIQISQFEHPNILSQVAGEPPPIVGAISLTELRNNLTSDPYWGSWVAESDYSPDLDVDLWDGRLYGIPDAGIPDGILDSEVDEDGEAMTLRAYLGLAPAVTEAKIREGLRRAFPRRYWRPGPEGDARILGRYPRQPAYAVFHDGMFEAAEKASLSVDLHAKVEIGCDVARFGDDMTVVHVQRGGLCLEHESRANSDTKQTALWLQDRIEHWARVYELDPRTEVIVRIDDTGVGGGVTDNAMGYTFIPVVAQKRAMRDERYPDARSEMSFNLAEAMADGRVSTARLPEPVRREIRRQAEKVMWKQDTRGRRRVYPKSVVKDALGRSPDDLDAMALAHYPLGRGAATIRSSGEAKSAPVHRREFSSGTSRLFG